MTPDEYAAETKRIAAFEELQRKQAHWERARNALWGVRDPSSSVSAADDVAGLLLDFEHRTIRYVKTLDDVASCRSQAVCCLTNEEHAGLVAEFLEWAIARTEAAIANLEEKMAEV